MKWSERPGHTARYGLMTPKPRQKVVSREADDVVRVDVEFKMSYCRFIDVAGRGEKKSNGVGRGMFGQITSSFLVASEVLSIMIYTWNRSKGADMAYLL